MDGEVVAFGLDRGCDVSDWVFTAALFPFIPRPLPVPLQIFILFVGIFSDQLVLCFKIVFVSPWLPFYPAGDCHPL